MPPPPPTVAAVEPDIRGAVTIRQQLEKHRDNASCAACHSKMDPPGFALESFDVMGGCARPLSRPSPKTSPPSQGLRQERAGRSRSITPCPSMRPASCPTAGRSRTSASFKRLLRPGGTAQIARNLARQLTVFATGAPVRFSDREEIERILDAAKASRYGVRSIVHAIVQSDLFLQQVGKDRA